MQHAVHAVYDCGLVLRCWSNRRTGCPKFSNYSTDAGRQNRSTAPMLTSVFSLDSAEHRDCGNLHRQVVTHDVRRALVLNVQTLNQACSHGDAPAANRTQRHKTPGIVSTAWFQLGRIRRYVPSDCVQVGSPPFHKEVCSTEQRKEIDEQRSPTDAEQEVHVSQPVITQTKDSNQDTSYWNSPCSAQ